MTTGKGLGMFLIDFIIQNFLGRNSLRKFNTYMFLRGDQDLFDENTDSPYDDAYQSRERESYPGSVNYGSSRETNSGGYGGGGYSAQGGQSRETYSASGGQAGGGYSASSGQSGGPYSAHGGQAGGGYSSSGGYQNGVGFGGYSASPTGGK